MTSNDAQIRVVVVDDHEVVRRGVAKVLDACSDIVVVGQSGTVAGAVETCDAVRPDVVVMDVRLADGSGIEATRDIRGRWPSTRIIMLTSFADEAALFAAILAGASGYVLKQVRDADFAGAVRRVAAGESLLDPASTATLFDRLRQNTTLLRDEKLSQLSEREGQILAFIAEGKTNREIADALFLSEKTVKNHISQILGKLQVSRRSEAAAYLARHTAVPGSSSSTSG